MEVFLSLINLGYIVSVIGGTEITTQLTKRTESSREARIIAFIVAAVLGIIWFFYFGVAIEIILVSFFVSAGFYSLVMKWIKNKLKGGTPIV